MYADVAVCLPLVRTFVYKLSTPVEAGCRVIVPFRKREVEGFVVGFRNDAPKDVEVHGVRSVVDEDPLLRPDIFELCRWIANYYVSPIGEVLKAALPPGITAKHVERHSPPRRGGGDATSTCGADGVARSASPIGRSLNRSSAEPVNFAGLTTPSAREKVASHLPIDRASTPPLQGGECFALTPDQANALSAIQNATGFKPILL